MTNGTLKKLGPHIKGEELKLMKKKNKKLGTNVPDNVENSGSVPLGANV